jgi:MinD-like ATPase involved in chromosome partitioning or flagellar assembly
MSTGTLVAVGSVDFESAVLTAASSGGLHVVRRCVDVADLLATAATRQAQAALVSTGLGGIDTEVLARLRDERVTTIGVVHDEASSDAGLLRRLGVDALVPVKRLDTLPALVAEAREVGRRGGTSAGGHGTDFYSGEPEGGAVSGGSPGRGSVIAVWGPTGAPGRSVVALGLASVVAGRGISTLVVDADVYGGSQAQLLGLLDESSGLLAAARAANRGRLDTQHLAAQARSVSPTLRVLSGLPRSDRWVELSPVLLRRILETARILCSLTILDCGFSVERDEEISYDISAPRRNGATLTALQTADVVVVVGSADPVGLGRLLRAVADLRVLAPDVRPWVVVNRMRSSLGWSGDEVAAMVRRTCQLEVEAFLPDDPAACDRAMVQGQTLLECAPGAKLTKALDRLATSVADTLSISHPRSARS